jgi:hypothetical protein
MLKFVKILLSALIALVALAALAFGVAWLLADRWDDQMSQPAAAQAGLPDVGWTYYGNDAYPEPSRAAGRPGELISRCTQTSAG